MKKVRAIDDILFEHAEVSRIPKGTVYAVSGVLPGGIVLKASDGEEYIIDPETFEAGFEIAEM